MTEELNFRHVKHFRRSNCDRFLTEADITVVRNLLGYDNYKGAFIFVQGSTKAPVKFAENIIRELQCFYNGSISNELEPEMDTFYPPIGGQG